MEDSRISMPSNDAEFKGLRPDVTWELRFDPGPIGELPKLFEINGQLYRRVDED